MCKSCGCSSGKKATKKAPVKKAKKATKKK
jgi:hypothetical protein